MDIKKTTYRLLFGLWILNIIDALCTLYALRIGYAYELNPFMRWVISKGDFAVLSLKIGGMGASCLILGMISKSAPKYTFWTSLVFFILYALIDLWHLAVYLMYKGGMVAT